MRIFKPGAEASSLRAHKILQLWIRDWCDHLEGGRGAPPPRPQCTMRAVHIYTAKMIEKQGMLLPKNGHQFNQVYLGSLDLGRWKTPLVCFFEP